MSSSGIWLAQTNINFPDISYKYEGAASVNDSLVSLASHILYHISFRQKSKGGVLFETFAGLVLSTVHLLKIEQTECFFIYRKITQPMHFTHVF